MFSADGRSWRMVELVDSVQLVYEGRALHHCVSSYTPRCMRGASRIWSLRQVSGDRQISVLTIEVEPTSGTVVQIRGHSNRRASGLAAALVRQWIERERLRVTRTVAAELNPPVRPQPRL